MLSALDNVLHAMQYDCMNNTWPPQSASTYFAHSNHTPRSGEKKTQVNLRIEPDLLADMAQIGNEEGLNLSDTARLLMREAITTRKKAKKKGNK